MICRPANIWRKWKNKFYCLSDRISETVKSLPDITHNPNRSPITDHTSHTTTRRKLLFRENFPHFYSEGLN
jgi:hypothetical protein